MAPTPANLTLERTFAALREARETFVPELVPHEVGLVTQVSTGIATVSGLPEGGFEELVRFPSGTYGIAFNIDQTEVGVILLGDCQTIQVGDQVARTGRVMDVAVGEGLLGRGIDPLGKPLDDRGGVIGTERRPVERPAPPTMERTTMFVTLQTGLTVIDPR